MVFSLKSVLRTANIFNVFPDTLMVSNNAVFSTKEAKTVFVANYKLFLT